MAESIVLQEPKRNDFRELLAELHLGCADYYWMPRSMATEESEAQTMKHFQSAQQQYAYLTSENPGKQDYPEQRGYVFARMARFSMRNRASDDSLIDELLDRAAELGYVSNLDSARRAEKAGDRKLAAQSWLKEIARYRSDPGNYESKGGTMLWWANLAANVIVDEYPQEAEWIWQEAIATSYDALKDFPSHRGYRHLFDGASWEYSKFLLRPERQPQALEQLDGLIRLNPAFHIVRARVLGKLGDETEQLQSLSKSVQQYPAQAQVLLRACSYLAGPRRA